MGTSQGALVVTHYQKDLHYDFGPEVSWRVVSSCGVVLRGADFPGIPDTNSEILKEVDCPQCRQKYALEFLAEVP